MHGRFLGLMCCLLWDGFSVVKLDQGFRARDLARAKYRSHHINHSMCVGNDGSALGQRGTHRANVNPT